MKEKRKKYNGYKSNTDIPMIMINGGKLRNIV